MTIARRVALAEGVHHRRSFVARFGLFAAVGLATPVLAGCGLLAARDDDRFAVQITAGHRFEPASLNIPLGATVVWDNLSNIRHAVTTDASDLEDSDAIILPDGVAAFSSGDLYPGETWELKFTLPGSYVYACPYYVDRGMVGAIMVEE